MRSSTIRLQLLAIRTQIEAQAALVDAILDEIADDQPATPAGCTHPADQREDTTTGGGSKRSFFCHGCRKTSDEIEAEQAGGKG